LGDFPESKNPQLGCDQSRRTEVQEQTNKKSLIEQGFTLIELLVVIAILGILAAVVVFSVNGITDRGKSSACTTEVSTVQTAIEAYNAKLGVYPPDAAPAGFSYADLNTALAPAPAGQPANPNKFLNSSLTATSPSIVAGYDYTGLGNFDGGTCP
jgi:prepilin-type N-terminal cleavage/methylation domain-containing protein